MAGEIEDCITLQAEHLPTGSISFGRFELETLSWERRSSFSRNRYLEDVVKCATPGSVTQKRAILEAHFNKKPLLPQASLENQSTSECQATENDLDHHASCSGEFENRDDVQQPEFVWYDETPTGSDGHDVECEQTGTWSSEFPIESTLCNNKRVVDSTYEQSDHDEILEHQPENDSMTSNKDDLCVVSEQELDNKAVIIEELLENKETVIVEDLPEKKEVIIVEELKSDVSPKSPAVEKKRVPTLKKKTQKSSVKVKEEKKTAKTKQTDQLPVQQNLRKLSSEKVYVSSGKMLSRSMGKVERESTLRAKLVKQLPSRASTATPSRTPMATSSDSKDLKLEGSVSMKAKVRQVNRREKQTTAKKSSITPNSLSERSEPDICRPVSRPRCADSAKEETKQSGAIFNFKSDERAEKRKEYYMMLEEKLHAKEVEMNEIQARTQEETEAALRQFRRSLNFKATPLPSFYHGTAPRASEGKKKVATPARPQKLESKCSTPGGRTSPQEKPPSLSEASNRGSPSSDEPNLASGSVNPSKNGKMDNRSRLGGNSGRKKGDIVNRPRRRSVGNVTTGSIPDGNVAVHAAF